MKGQVSGSLADLREAAGLLRTVEGVVAELRSGLFPNGTVVRVNHPRYKGFGIVCWEDCPPDKLAVMLRHKESRWYEIETVEPVPDRSEWPAWIVRQRRSDAGRKAAFRRRQNQQERLIRARIEGRELVDDIG